MWYEIIPSLAIVGAAVGLPHVLCYATHRILLKRPYRRTMKDRIDQYMYLRDERISGDAYKPKFLDALMDK